MMDLKVLFVLFLSNYVHPLDERPLFAMTKPGVVGGKPAKKGQFPFMVLLLKGESVSCGGSLINKQWILTATHCLTEYCNNNSSTANTSLPDSICCLSPPSRLKVLIGTHDINSGGTIYEIKKMIVHKQFFENEFKNDIGLIQIDGTLEYSDTVQPIEFGKVGPDENCTAMGWGITKKGRGADVLQYMDILTIDLDFCFKISRKYGRYYLGKEQVCAIAPAGHGTCHGDSGGPLVCNGKLAGITSYAFIPCDIEYPSVYTRVTSYLDWIENNIK